MMQALQTPRAWIAALLLLLAAPLAAQDGGAEAGQETGPKSGQETDALLDLLQVPETLDIMRSEGRAYATTLAEDMLPGQAGGAWGRALDRIYDLDRMERTVRVRFAETFAETGAARAPLEAFFASDLGREIVALEVSARRAMLDPAIEEAARETYTARRAAAEDGEDPRLAQIDDIIVTHDLVEANVAGGMNSSVRFYQGLADGGAIGLGEADILAQVWASREESRADTEEWLYGFMLMAYRPLDDAELAAYAALFDSDAGQALNAALFDGFDAMFAEVSYALGMALAREMQSEEL